MWLGPAGRIWQDGTETREKTRSPPRKQSTSQFSFFFLFLFTCRFFNQSIPSQLKTIFFYLDPCSGCPATWSNGRWNKSKEITCWSPPLNLLGPRPFYYFLIQIHDTIWINTHRKSIDISFFLSVSVLVQLGAAKEVVDLGRLAVLWCPSPDSQPALYAGLKEQESGGSGGGRSRVADLGGACSWAFFLFALSHFFSPVNTAGRPRL